MATNSIRYYRTRQEAFTAKSKRQENKHHLVSFFRILVFIFMIIAFVFTVRALNNYLIALEIVLFIPLFGLLVKLHQKIADKRDHYAKISQINGQEIHRLKGELKHFDSGKEFATDKHPYVDDLDIFGSHSLFQLINHTNSIPGRTTLSDWLKTPASKKEIEDRQVVVQALQNQIDWRQSFQAAGISAHHDQGAYQQFMTWLKTANKLSGQKLLRIYGYAVPIVSLAIIILLILQIIHWRWILLPILVNSSIIAYMFKYAAGIHSSTKSGSKVLKSYHEMVTLIENKEFQIERLKRLKSRFFHHKIRASTRIRQLHRLLHNFNNRENMLYPLINVLFLTDLFLILEVERWKNACTDQVERWLKVVAEFESLCSLAAFAHLNPEYCYPEITSVKFLFRTGNMGHPLIEKTARVNNDFQLSDKGKIAMITGSNMAGKSTFLRTVGINTVLAFAGAPVCADKLEISSLRVFTSMRTKDNLEEHVSGFYAELLRLKMLLQYIESGREPVLFLLDEILKGTNSADRHEGAEALIRQLGNSSAFGLISTHDLALGQLKDNNNIENFSFNSYFEDNKMFFDYKIRRGICKVFNAKNLMAEIGIRM